MTSKFIKRIESQYVKLRNIERPVWIDECRIVSKNDGTIWATQMRIYKRNGTCSDEATEWEIEPSFCKELTLDEELASKKD
jgi:hypothetical protein